VRQTVKPAGCPAKQVPCGQGFGRYHPICRIRATSSYGKAWLRRPVPGLRAHGPREIGGECPGKSQFADPASKSQHLAGGEMRYD
jgi:hypothetical protein